MLLGAESGGAELNTTARDSASGGEGVHKGRSSEKGGVDVQKESERERWGAGSERRAVGEGTKETGDGQHGGPDSPLHSSYSLLP